MTYSTYTRIGDFAVEDDMEVYTHAMNYKRKYYSLSDELKKQWPEGETRREDDFRIGTGKYMWDITEYAYPLTMPSSPDMQQAVEFTIWTRNNFAVVGSEHGNAMWADMNRLYTTVELYILFLNQQKQK